MLRIGYSLSTYTFPTVSTYVIVFCGVLLALAYPLSVPPLHAQGMSLLDVEEEEAVEASDGTHEGAHEDAHEGAHERAHERANESSHGSDIPAFRYEGDGVAHQADHYWEDYRDSLGEEVSSGEMGPTEATVKHTYATVMGFFVDLSGFKQVERSAAHLGHDVGHGADGWTVTKDSAVLLGNSALAGSNFLPIAGAARGVSSWRSGLAPTRSGSVPLISRGTKAGTSIRMLRAGSAAADEVAAGLKAAIRAAAPEGRITAQNMDDVFRSVRSFADEYGIQLTKGGNLGESVGSIDIISANLKAGGPHELAHVIQQVQTRATAFASVADDLGKPVSALTQAEKARAFDQFIRPFEAATYAHHERYAYEATGFGGRGGNRYGAAIESNIDEFAQAYQQGTVPNTRVGVGARAYGEMPEVLGTSQAEMGYNTVGATAGTYNSQR